MLLLAIESSCDETAAAVLQDGINLLSSVVDSQIECIALMVALCRNSLPAGISKPSTRS